MKKVPAYYTKCDQIVEAYQKDDIERLRPLFRAASDAWEQEWIKQGKKDEGTCTGGKGIEVWFVGPRQRVAKPLRVIASPPVQGNLSAQRSVDVALNILKDAGISAEYNDGWMD